jgi:hypothetical protein
MNEVVPIHIDQLFTLLFTSSKFYLDFHASRKTTDLTQTPWTHNASDNTKSRVVNLTVALNQTMGPKTAQVTESQVISVVPSTIQFLSKCFFRLCFHVAKLVVFIQSTLIQSMPAFLTQIALILFHHCLQKISETESSYQVFAQVIYKKSVWGLVKGNLSRSLMGVF